MDARMRCDREKYQPNFRDERAGRTSRAVARIDRWSTENDDGEVFKNCWTLLDFTDAARYRLPE
jgi:hypothetical protein